MAEQNGRLYVPVSKPLPTPPPPAQDYESMYLDDTSNKVYIHNLDAELSEIDAEDEKLVFLPDIERKLGRIPEAVLLSNVHPSAQNQMVLYSVPSSLSVPEEQDSVRKAIIESRERAREKSIRDAEAEAAAQTNGHKETETMKQDMDTGGDGGPHFTTFEEDEDAMDLG